MKGVYIIPCSCGTPYIGETGRFINQRISEHAVDLKHRRIKSSALAEHVEKTKCYETSSRKDEDVEALLCTISIIQPDWINKARDEWKNDEEV